jgi:hypothetical protein
MYIEERRLKNAQVIHNFITTTPPGHAPLLAGETLRGASQKQQLPGITEEQISQPGPTDP